MTKYELPHLIELYYGGKDGIQFTKPTKELIRELVNNYNELITYLRGTEDDYGRTEE